MKKWVVAGVATLAVIGTAIGVSAYAQGKSHRQTLEQRFDGLLERVDRDDRRGWRRHRNWSAEDRAAFLDARLAAVKAGLKFTPEQEKLWSPVETTVRELGKKWGDRMAERRAERQKRREMRDDANQPAVDPIARIRARSERLAERAADMKRFADAAQPLYATLDEAQKNRLQSLLPQGRRHMWHRWRDRDDRDDRSRRPN